jgi:hypothetical protein
MQAAMTAPSFLGTASWVDASARQNLWRHGLPVFTTRQ